MIPDSDEANVALDAGDVSQPVQDSQKQGDPNHTDAPAACSLPEDVAGRLARAENLDRYNGLQW